MSVLSSCTFVRNAHTLPGRLLCMNMLVLFELMWSGIVCVCVCVRVRNRVRLFPQFTLKLSVESYIRYAPPQTYTIKRERKNEFIYTPNGTNDTIMVNLNNNDSVEKFINKIFKSTVIH